MIVARSQRLPEQAISSETLFHDIAEELIAAARLLSADRIAALIPPRDVPAVQRRLHDLLQGRWQARWQKCNYRPRNPAGPVKSKPDRRKQTKPHDSVHRILQRQSQ